MNTENIAVRIDPKIKKRFNKKAAKLGAASDVHRELITAFVEDRLTVTAPHQQQHKLEKLYES